MKKTIAALTIILVFANGWGYTQQIPGQINYRRVTASPGEDAPTGRGQGAGSSSGECQIGEEQTPLVAVVPEEANKSGVGTSIWAKTSQKQPKFWFYVAYPTNTQVMFELQDEQENSIYTTSFTLQGTPGLVSITLPATHQGVLEAGQKYLWYFYVMCAQHNSPDDFVTGWVEVVELDAKIIQGLEQAAPQQRIAMYAQEGLWHDTITQVQELRSQEPENQHWQEIWLDLLQQVSLGDIGHASVVQQQY